MARNDKYSREPKDNLIKKTVSINRVTKVVKGGRTMRFAALVVVGDGANQVGYGLGKAKEVPEAIEKATKEAKKSMITFSIKDNTVPHAVKGVYGRGEVIIMPAEQGTGVIAGGAVRAVLETTGIKDVRTKSIGSNNPINCVKATVEGLKQMRTAEEIAKMRGIPVSNLVD
ncbi:MAG: 30S ribosomal protein S5 [Clostridia bacterium]